MGREKRMGSAIRCSIVLSVLALPAPAQTPVTFESAGMRIKVEVVARGLQAPWGLAFLPDGRLLVTERAGRLRIVGIDGALSAPLGGLPPIRARGQGGLLDIALDRDFARNRTIYFCFAEPRANGQASTALASARLPERGNAIEDVRKLFAQQPAGAAGRHFGCRIAQRSDRTLFLTLGDRGDLSESAQDPKTHIGKVIRINPDGSVPGDNPFAGNGRGLPEIWSIGHRNVQGAALRPGTDELWTAEHGARGGDEINQPKAGRNYGWPVITYGVDYSGAKIGIGTRKEGMEQPVYYWDPSIAPSGMAFYVGDRFPGWRNSVFVGALAGQLLARLTLDGNSITGEERLLTRFGARIRDVRFGPDGYLYLLTDNDQDRILRLKPAQ
jgi:glucose/arabinose dehydrogenase